jgi:hypothetical protein
VHEENEDKKEENWNKKTGKGTGGKLPELVSGGWANPNL